MFTGIIQGTGTVKEISVATKTRNAINLLVNLGRHSKGLRTGQSVAINGVCLTAAKLSGTNCNFEVIDETVKKTDLGNLKEGQLVNIERSLKANDRLEGHFVLGHVDGVGTIKSIDQRPKELQVKFVVPKKLAKYIVKKGSIAVDGISLTVTDINNSTVSISLIPHTVRLTNFQTKKIGDKINIETDILGKYILKQR